MQIKDLKCPNCATPLPTRLFANQLIECRGCGSTLALPDLDLEQALVCAACGIINGSDQRYCVECGQPLYSECILCHTKNQAGTAYCQRCGVNLTQNRLRRQMLMGDRQRVREERNQLFREKMARQQAEKLERLLEDLDEPENHAFAIYQINQMGVEAVKALIETLLNDADPDARYGSARALGQICQAHEVKGMIKARSAKALIQALADEEVTVRYWAADALGKCGSRTAIEPLVKLLADKHEGVRQQARESLVEIAGDEAAEIIAAADKSKGVFGWIKN
ncbi:MAG TPA: HEAT repeat domain-containing protein [Anaerolineae bacterium]|nr:HEAT repeat domain-containing protein [Anaerolineae bacterium]